MERSSIAMMKEESVDRIKELEGENLALQSLADTLRWRLCDIWMIGIACFCMGFISHIGFICFYNWLAGWF